MDTDDNMSNSDSEDDYDNDSNIGIFRVNSKTGFWILSLDKKTLNVLEEKMKEMKKEMYLTNYVKVSIKKGDIILMYKRGIGGGFIGIVNTDDQQINNQEGKIRIFNDNNMNRYCVKLSNFVKIPITKISDMENSFKDDTDFKSSGSFKVKYITGDLCYSQPTNKFGKKLLEYLLSRTNNSSGVTSENENESDKPVKTKKTGKIMLTNNDDYDDKIKDKKTKHDTKQKQEQDQEQEQDTDDIENTKGLIPILINPCKKFIWPATNKVTYFIKHYQTCMNCEIVNNNNYELTNILGNDTDIELLEIDDQDLENYSLAEEAYQSLKKYDPYKKSKKNKIQIIYNMDLESIYANCFIICWRIQI